MHVQMNIDNVKVDWQRSALEAIYWSMVLRCYLDNSRNGLLIESFPFTENF